MQSLGRKLFWVWDYLGLQETRCLRRPYHIHMLILHHLSLVRKKKFLKTKTSMSQSKELAENIWDMICPCPPLYLRFPQKK